MYRIMENNVLIITCAAILIIQLCLMIEFRQKQYRRWWVWPVNRSSRTSGFYLTLFRELKNTDYEEFYVYTRMSPRNFDCLLNMMRPLLLKRILRGRRIPLDSKLKLALILSHFVLNTYFSLSPNSVFSLFNNYIHY